MAGISSYNPRPRNDVANSSGTSRQTFCEERCLVSSATLRAVPCEVTIPLSSGKHGDDPRGGELFDCSSISPMRSTRNCKCASGAWLIIMCTRKSRITTNSPIAITTAELGMLSTASLRRQCLICRLRAIEGIVTGRLRLGADIFPSCGVGIPTNKRRRCGLDERRICHRLGPAGYATVCICPEYVSLNHPLNPKTRRGVRRTSGLINREAPDQSMDGVRLPAPGPTPIKVAVLC